MKKIINLTFLTVILVIYFSSCTKEVPKELQNRSTQDNSEKKMPDDSIHRNLKSADPHSTLSENNSGTKRENVDPSIANVESKIRNKLSAKVKVSHNSKIGKGKIVISYNNMDEMERILSNMHIK